jgi:hypothetical protein
VIAAGRVCIPRRLRRKLAAAPGQPARTPAELSNFAEITSLCPLSRAGIPSALKYSAPASPERGIVLVDWTSSLGNVPENRPVRRATGGFSHALASAGRLAVCS